MKVGTPNTRPRYIFFMFRNLVGDLSFFLLGYPVVLHFFSSFFLPPFDYDCYRRCQSELYLFLPDAAIATLLASLVTSSDFFETPLSLQSQVSFMCENASFCCNLFNFGSRMNSQDLASFGCLTPWGYFPTLIDPTIQSYFLSKNKIRVIFLELPQSL